MTDMLEENKVHDFIWRPKPDKAAGIDELPNRFLRAITGGMLKTLTHLFQAYVTLGYHSMEFKKANTIILKKPRKEDYSEPKSYRPIALLSTLSKAL